MILFWPAGRLGAAFARWACTLLGGILLGAGLLLWGQAVLLDYVQDQVGARFFLVRWVGKVSFVFLAVDQKVPLALADIPAEVVAESARWARALMILGGCVGVLALFLRSPGRGGGRKGKKR